jgi:transcriptional regulator GlxA family with amidase domain
MHQVAILALDGVVAFDLAVPMDVFKTVFLPDGKPAYDVKVCSNQPEIDAGLVAMRIHHGLEALATVDTVIVPGVIDLQQAFPPEVLAALRAAAARGARIASICSGAFVLAAAGLLDGRRATTHWLATRELAQRYPAVQVDPDVLFVDNGQLLTSAGAAAGLDLCFHLVRRDHGAVVAAAAARLSVMPLERAGGQAQFIVHAPPGPDDGSLEPLLRWIEGNLDRELALEDLAARAAVSVRTLNRQFQAQTGTTPLQWLLRARIRRAQALLEASELPVDRVAREVGFRSAVAFRARFKQVLGTTPTAYRRALGQRGAEQAGLGM